MTAAELAQLRMEEQAKRIQRQKDHEAALVAPVLDPNPTRRRRFERQVVFRSLRRRGRLTHAVKLARTERSFLWQSSELPTSIKKLTKIMNQIAGKTLEEAFVQLRFSKKRIAIDVSKALDQARYEAMIRNGMGLGAVEGADGTRKIAKVGDAFQIELKDGTRSMIQDPTEIYIDQAWVGRRAPTQSPEYRARGRVNMLTHRRTSTYFISSTSS